MNKKQLLVMWGAGIWISIIFIAHLCDSYRIDVNDLIEALMWSVPVFIMSGLLVYTFKNKKK